MPNIIATENDARTIGGSSGSYTSNLCATKARALALNCGIRGNYESGQLVPLTDLFNKESSYLRFTTLSPGTFTFTGHNIDYSLDNGGSWITLQSGTATPNLNTGSEILWRYNLDPNEEREVGRFSSTCSFNVSGNAMSLLYGDNFANQTIVMIECFWELFSWCAGLVDASNLALPATTLDWGCYRSMFVGCTSLIAPPSLPATTLVGECYNGMFSGCISLSVSPELPATTFAPDCYSFMFYDTNTLPDTSRINFSDTTHTTSGAMSGLFAGTKVTYQDLQNIP